MIENIVSLGALVIVLTGVSVWQRWNYVRARRLMSAGYRSEYRRGSDVPAWQYHSPDEPEHVNYRSLGKSYRRYALMKEHKDLNVPTKPQVYQLGDFMEDSTP